MSDDWLHNAGKEGKKELKNVTNHAKALFGLSISKELQRLLDDEGLSHASGPLLNAGVKTIEDLGQMEEEQLHNLDLPVVSKRKLKSQVEKVRSQQTFVDAVRPTLKTEKPPDGFLNRCLGHLHTKK